MRHVFKAGLSAVICRRDDPAKYSDPEWQKWIRKMSKKAKLNAVQEDLLTRYLSAYRIAAE